jgi:meiotic recombination protein REC8, fungi type
MDFDMLQLGNGNEMNRVDAPSTSSHVQQDSSISFVVSHETEEVAAIPLRRTRLPKPIPADSILELRQREMNEHNHNYIENMRYQQREHLLRRLPLQARKNADYFILDRGINGISKFILPNIDHPLSMFHGTQLFEWATGKQPIPQKSKRDREDEDSDHDSRRVRARQDDYEFGPTIETDNHDFALVQYDEVELPRERAVDLTDNSSVMPWNISISARGSSASRVGSVAMLNSATRQSRFVSTSPRHGRGPSPVIDEEGFRTIDDFDIPGSIQPDEDDSRDIGLLSTANVVLDTESSNFLTFVRQSIDAKQADVDQLATQLNTDPRTVDSIAFDELLPTQNNSRSVAAHGMLYVLSLSTKSVLKVDQFDHFGTIFISLP